MLLWVFSLLPSGVTLGFFYLRAIEFSVISLYLYSNIKKQQWQQQQ